MIVTNLSFIYSFFFLFITIFCSIDTKFVKVINNFCLSNRPNVCTERKEEISDWNSSPMSASERSDDENSEQRDSMSVGGSFHFSFNTCVEKANKRTCKSV